MNDEASTVNYEILLKLYYLWKTHIALLFFSFLHLKSLYTDPPAGHIWWHTYVTYKHIKKHRKMGKITKKAGKKESVETGEEVETEKVHQ